ncbi:MAG: adenylate/guanylate cyclase domain-containing protein [Nitrosopumilaceae archaeon]
MEQKNGLLKVQRSIRKKNNTNSNDKNSKIAEILGLLEESGKGKEWILQEIKKHKLKTQIKTTMNSFEILKHCPDGFVSHLLLVLKNDGFENFPDIKTLTKTYHWFFTDIVGSANPDVLTKDQARKVWALNELVGRTETFRQRNMKSDLMTITGDGMVIGFNDSPEKPLRLAIELHKIISKYNQIKKGKDKLNIRIGIDTGPVYFIKDLTGKDNFWGPGIIMARRVMDLARPMQILASSRIAEDVRKLSPENKSVMHYIGDYKIKHNEKLSLYNIYGDGWGNKLAPHGKIDAKKIDEGPNPVKFLFPKIELKLAITNLKTMMTHHTWIWNIVNVTDHALDQVSYYIEGDVPRDFSDLNISIKDEENNKLQIISVNVNKPYNKEFLVKLNKPLKPRQKRRYLKLEYDWEEPERNFLYTLSTDCKKFKYFLTLPKGLEIKQRVLKVDPATRFKIHASPSAEIKYLKDKTEITWQASNLHAYDAYRFEW